MAIKLKFKITSPTKWNELSSENIMGDNDSSRSVASGLGSNNHTISEELDSANGYEKLVTLTWADSAAHTKWANIYNNGSASKWQKTGFTITGPI